MIHRALNHDAMVRAGAARRYRTSAASGIRAAAAGGADERRSAGAHTRRYRAGGGFQRIHGA
jgi:hypothetical protein